MIERWLFYLLVFQTHVKRLAAFLAKLLKCPALESSVKTLWRHYLNRWREDSLPLISKFTYSHPGHYESKPNSKLHLGPKPLSAQTAAQLDHQIPKPSENPAPKQQTFNYDMIFSDRLGGAPKRKSSSTLADLLLDSHNQNGSKPIFLPEQSLSQARLFDAKSKRRFKSERKIVKKALGDKNRRRRRLSIVDGEKTGEIEKLRVAEDLENSVRTEGNPLKFWRVLWSDYDKVCEAFEFEYVMKLYVDNMIVKSGHYNSLLDWQKDRDDKLTAHSRIASFLAEKLFLDSDSLFVAAMNPVYLDDFKCTLYSTVFLIELLEHLPMLKTNSTKKEKDLFPCHIKDLRKMTEALPREDLKNRFLGEIDKFEETVELVCADYTEMKEHCIEITQILNITGPDEPPTLWNDNKLEPTKDLYPLDDHLLFVLPFVAAKLHSIGLSARAYLDILQQHPRDTLGLALSEHIAELKSDAIPHFMSVRLRLSPASIRKYQFRFCEFVFENFAGIHRAFPNLYENSHQSLPPALLFPVTFYLSLLKKLAQESSLPPALLALANTLFCALLAAQPFFVVDREELLCLSLLLFLFKAFYGICIDAPALLNISKNQLEKEPLSASDKQTMLKCLEFIDHTQSTDSLTHFVKSLPSLDTLLGAWTRTYRKLSRHSDAMEVFPLTQEQQSSLTYTQVISLVDSLGAALLSVRPKTLTFDDKPRAKEKIRKDADTVQVAINYPQKPGDWELKDSLQAEVDFVLGCLELPQEEQVNVELPHPSDVFVRFKKFMSVPENKLPQDFLLLLELFTVLSGVDKQTLLQTMDKTESMLLNLLHR